MTHVAALALAMLAASQARSPEAILADSVAATGGEAAWRSHKTARFKVETTFQGMGMGGTGDRFLTAAGKSLVVSEMTGLGTVREGHNGKRAWSQDPLLGFRFLEGAEAESARLESAWNAELDAKKYFVKLEATNETAADGAKLECVLGTPKIGKSMKSCYDRTTHLQVSQSGIRATPQGDVPFRATMSDWRSVGGVKMPFLAETQVGPVTLLVKIKSVTFDEPIDDKMFEPPMPAAPARK
jgi:hypothetical protein